MHTHVHILEGLCCFSGENTFLEKVRRVGFGERKREKRFSISFSSFTLFHTQLNYFHVYCVCVSVFQWWKQKEFELKHKRKQRQGRPWAWSFFCVPGQPSRHSCFSSWESFHPLALNPGRAQIQQEADKALVHGWTATPSRSGGVFKCEPGGGCVWGVVGRGWTSLQRRGRNWHAW